MILGSSLLRALQRTARRLRVFICGLHGHDTLFHFISETRVCLECANCGWQSPGWDRRGARSTTRARILPLAGYQVTLCPSTRVGYSTVQRESRALAAGKR